MKTTRFMGYTDFWNWFLENSDTFYQIVKIRGKVDKEVFEKLSAKLSEIREGYYFLAGIADEETAELIITADGNLKNIAFVEELVAAAPSVPNWKFTALKPPWNAEAIHIELDSCRFDKDNLFFYSNDLSQYPDEIDISVIYEGLTEENKTEVFRGVFIYLDNYLGELDFIKNIDNLKVVAKSEAEKDLIPISKLKDFLNWRQKEFVEKYDGKQFPKMRDEGALFEAISETGNPLTAVVNLRMINWDGKASHPWIAVMTMKYKGGNDGMPTEKEYDRLDELELNLTRKLSNRDGYLFIGRQIGDGAMEVYFACRDFRKPSKIFYRAQLQYSDQFDIEYDLYKDKYWRSFDNFRMPI